MGVAASAGLHRSTDRPAPSVCPPPYNVVHKKEWAKKPTTTTGISLTEQVLSFTDQVTARDARNPPINMYT